MKIYTFLDFNTSCIAGTMGGISNLNYYIPTAEVTTYHYDALKNRTFDGDSGNDVLFIFEIGNPQHSNWTTKQLREKFPNAKFVALCSDTIYYQLNGLPFQMDPDGIDLHLEVMPQSVEWLNSKGIRAEFFRWGISDDLINKALAFASNTFFKDFADKLHDGHSKNLSYKKDIDFIGVYHPGTISNPQCWRHHAVKHIENNGYIFTQGGGNGHQDDNIERLLSHYTRSKFTLGTSSHNRPELTRLGCMKFFRDELGPLLNSLLIYDKHPNVELRYNYGKEVVPLYDYDNFESILDLHKKLWNSVEYDRLLFKQKIFVMRHSFERELLRCLVKHNIIDKELVCETL